MYVFCHAKRGEYIVTVKTRNRFNRNSTTGGNKKWNHYFPGMSYVYNVLRLHVGMTLESSKRVFIGFSLREAVRPPKHETPFPRRVQTISNTVPDCLSKSLNTYGENESRGTRRHDDGPRDSSGNVFCLSSGSCNVANTRGERKKKKRKRTTAVGISRARQLHTHERRGAGVDINKMKSHSTDTHWRCALKYILYCTIRTIGT